MGKLILVLGGARSGKSTFALQLAARAGAEPVLFVATAAPGDDEFQARIIKHRRERPSTWTTLEAQKGVGAAILDQGAGHGAVIVDCLTFLVANLIMPETETDPFAPALEAAVFEEVDALRDCAQQLPGPLIVISNEVGMGLVPPYPLGRAYRDLLGYANQRLAKWADTVYLLVAGIPMTIKEAGSPR